MPGFTHLQSGQPVTLGPHLMPTSRCWRATTAVHDARRGSTNARWSRRAGRDRFPMTPTQHPTRSALRGRPPTASIAFRPRFVVDYLHAAPCARCICRGWPRRSSSGRRNRLASSSCPTPGDRIVDHAQQAQPRRRRTGPRPLRPNRRGSGRGAGAAEGPAARYARTCRTTKRRCSTRTIADPVAPGDGWNGRRAGVRRDTNARGRGGRHSTATDLADWLVADAGIPFARRITLPGAP